MGRAAASLRQMRMTGRLRKILGTVTVGGVLTTSGCGAVVMVSAEGCSVTASIGFEGREYTATRRVDGITSQDVNVGRRLGVGEVATACTGSRARRVRVYEVVGVPAARAVYAEPAFGLMQRTHLDEQ